MKRLFDRVLCGLVIINMILLTACSGAEAERLSFTAMDTVMSLTVYGGSETCEKVRDRAAELDKKLSAVDEDSEIFALDRDGNARLSEDTAKLVRRSLELCEKLEGYFDVTVYPAVREWGFTTGEYKVPDEKTLAELARRIDYTAVTVDGNTVKLPEGVMIDLGAVAKGYLADEAGRIAAESGADGAVLNLGGTVKLFGKKPDGTEFGIGIADPGSPAAYFGILSLDEGVISTSGGYERYFELDGKRYIHILDPNTATPVDNGVLSVTAVTDEGVYADALSTALFVMGEEKAADFYRKHGDFEYLMLTADGRVMISEGLSKRFSLCEGYGFSVSVVS